MKSRFVYLFFSVVVVFSLISPSALFSEATSSAPEADPLFVTATRTPAEEERIGKAVSLIPGEVLELSTDLSINESLRQVPGVRVQQLGGPGTFTNIRLRGLRSSDTQLLINGLPFRDPSATQADASGFFQEFRTDFLQQIEVVRGANTTLYGSDAVGGSINLIPVTPMGKPTLDIGFEGGTLNTYKQTYSVRGGEKILNYLLGYSRTTSDGIDSHDEYDNNSYTVLLNSSPTENVELGFDFMASDTRLDLNNGATLVGGKLITASDDPNDFRDSEFFFYGTHLIYHANENWDHILRFGAVDANREFVTKTDPDGTDFPRVSEFFGNTYNIEYQSNLQVGETHLVSFGFEHEREEFEQTSVTTGPKTKEEKDEYRNSWYLQDQMNFLDETLFLTGGIRLTDHETIGTDVNGEGSIAYLIKDWGTRLHSHIGTGMRTPSLFELFGAGTFGGFRVVFGNPDLDPEESISWDIGVGQELFDGRGNLDVTFFLEEVEDLIQFIGTGYINAGDADSHGIEASLLFELTQNIATRFFYTWTDSEDVNGNRVLGIPEHIWGFDLIANFLERFELLVRGTYNGKYDFNVFSGAPIFAAVRVEGDDYFKVDAVLTCKINDHAEVYVRAENLFDEEIIENGFEGIPVIVFGGIKIKI